MTIPIWPRRGAVVKPNEPLSGDATFGLGIITVLCGMWMLSSRVPGASPEDREIFIFKWVGWVELLVMFATGDLYSLSAWPCCYFVMASMFVKIVLLSLPINCVALRTGPADGELRPTDLFNVHTRDVGTGKIPRQGKYGVEILYIKPQPVGITPCGIPWMT